MRTTAPPLLHRLRAATVLLAAAAVSLSTAVALPQPAAAVEGASFTWTMPDRFGLDQTGDGMVDYVAGTTDHPGPVKIKPDSWRVDLDACASPAGSTFSWRVVDSPDPADPLQITGGPGCGDFDLVVRDEGTYRVELTATKDGQSTKVVEPVVVQDWLILSLGDSSGSGEGVPDKEIDQTSTQDFAKAWRDVDAAVRKLTTIETSQQPLLDLWERWKVHDHNIKQHCVVIGTSPGGAWKAEECLKEHGYAFDLFSRIVVEAVVFGLTVTGETIVDLGNLLLAAVEAARATVAQTWQIFFTLLGVFRASWQDQQCHRSADAGSAQAAKRLEQEDKKTSVTFVHLACSGASVVYGLLGNYAGVEPVNGLTNEACNPKDEEGRPLPRPEGCILDQVTRAKHLVGLREIDAVYVSIGGNDAHFADIVLACITQNPCHETNWAADKDAVKGSTCASEVWYTVVPGWFCERFFDAIPITQTNPDGSDATMNAAQLWEEGKKGDVHAPINPMFQGHEALYQQLAARLSGTKSKEGVVKDGEILTYAERSRVFLSEYVDATLDDEGERCGKPESGILTIPGFSQREFDWIAATVAPELNTNVRTATTTHGWTMVDGIYEQFENHGYCARDTYLVRLQESFLRQGNKEGTVHPNVKGHRAYADNILREWKEAFYPTGSMDAPRGPRSAPYPHPGGPYAVDEGSTVQLTNDSYDYEGEAITYTWFAPPGTSIDDRSARTPVLTGLDDSGTRRITLSTRDEDGSRLAQADVTVRNVAPTVSAGDDVEIVEGGTVTGDATFTDPGTLDTHTVRVDYGDGTVETPAVTGTTVPLTHRYTQDGSYTLAVTVTDDDGGAHTDSRTVTVANAAPVLTEVVAPREPQLVGATVTATTTFTDAGVDDTHTATISWGDGSTQAVPAGSGTLTAQHAYTTPGTYTITATVTDDAGAVDTEVFEHVVVYDPSGGFVTGGGTLDSPAGAVPARPTLTGPAHFSFVSKYQKGAKVPTGRTSFTFKAAGMDFRSESYDWLVVSGTRAQYKGTGSLDGVPGWTFTVAAVDGDAKTTGADRLRVKIWKDDVVAYDNQLGVPLDALATPAVKGQIHIGQG